MSDFANYISSWTGLLTLLLGLGLLVGGIAYLMGSGRRHRTEGATATIDLLTKEVEARDIAITRLTQAHEYEKEQRSKLGGIVEQLREENASLRSLVMGETVPAAMQAALQAFTQVILESNRDLIREYRNAAKGEHDALFQMVRAVADHLGTQPTKE